MWIDPQHVENINDPLEKALVDTYKLAYQVGKGSRKLVPLLLPNDTLQPMKNLFQERQNFVSDENVCLFPNISNSKDHVIGWNCITAVSKAMGSLLKNPHLLIADKFRHRISTLYALEDVSEAERQVLYRHMGHSEEMNQNLYQCPLAIGKFLRNVNEQINSGKSTLCSPDEPDMDDQTCPSNDMLCSKIIEPENDNIMMTQCLRRV